LHILENKKVVCFVGYAIIKQISYAAPLCNTLYRVRAHILIRIKMRQGQAETK